MKYIIKNETQINNIIAERCASRFIFIASAFFYLRPNEYIPMLNKTGEENVVFSWMREYKTESRNYLFFIFAAFKFLFALFVKVFCEK